ncbi:bifunctional non-homologous end joining protein LigD [Frankineae bacterium MT45]|nr:bifunctional non-homologous end joining protein LigD [Frankineae bacterium MT45]
MSKRVAVEVQGRQLSLSNLQKVMYPEPGFTKGEVIDYYTRIAPLMLPHLAARPLTVKRYPNGVDAPFFYEKNAPKNTPDWVPTARIAVPGSTMDRETIDFLIVEELATLVWLANQAALELHTPQWQVTSESGRRGSGAPKPRTDLIVFDLDPGKPAGIAECAEVALLLRTELVDAGLRPAVKTSGSKGIQVSAAVSVTAPDETSKFAKQLATRLAERHPKLIVSKMAKTLRGGKVLIDWSQNNAAKTTVAPYSLRARSRPTVSTPVSWDELQSPQNLVFTAADVLERVERLGDLYSDTLKPPNHPQLVGERV